MKTSRIYWAISILLAGIIITGVTNNKPTISVGNKSVRVTIADSPQEIVRGLSGIQSLGADEGMLFVFPEPTTPAFWMKDMRFAIDIIWLDENKNIIDIERNVSPDTYPKKFEPSRPVRYVLETNPGLVSF